MTKLEAIALIGTLVFISDGTPRPPARFNRKLEKWKTKNFGGILTEVKDWEPIGNIPARTEAVILVKDAGFIVLFRSGYALDRLLTEAPGTFLPEDIPTIESISSNPEKHIKKAA